VTGVGVIVCVRDGEPWLAEALDSIVGQSRPPDELVIVDDGSSDGSMAIAARYPARIVPGPQAGIAAAYSTGVAAAGADLIGFLGQDDRYAPGALEALADALDEHPEAGIAAGTAVLFTDEEEHFSGLRGDRLGTPHATRLPESVLIRRDVLAPLLPLRLGAAWDLDMLLRLDEAGARTVRVDHLVCHKRLRPGSAIHDPGNGHQEQMLAALRHAIQRRRDAGRS
jgi:glycosyltransferase involved in cell wall biosynthesis